MKYIITKKQIKLLYEINRNWMDSDYQDEYNNVKNSLISFIHSLFESYAEDDSSIYIYDSNNDVMIYYNKKSGELFFNREIEDVYSDFFPHPFWNVHSKYALSDLFEELFPKYKVNRVKSANM